MSSRRLINLKPESWRKAVRKRKGVSTLIAYSTSKCIECVCCMRQRSRADILSGFYRMETMVCSDCYSKMQQLPYENSCFGKPSYVKNQYNPARIHGYSANAVECNQLCPDTAVCGLIVSGVAPKP